MSSPHCRKHSSDEHSSSGEDPHSDRGLAIREAAFLADLRAFYFELQLHRHNLNRVDTGTSQIETRMINILSFSTTVEMFLRQLDVRTAHAHSILSESPDDLTALEHLTELAEAAVCSLPSLSSTVNDDLSLSLVQSQLATELVESQNAVRRTHLSLARRDRFRTARVAPIRFAARPTARAPPPPPPPPRANAETAETAAAALSALSSSRQRALDATHGALAAAEAELDAELQRNRGAAAAREARIAALRAELHENAALEVALAGARDENARAVEEIADLRDSGARLRREAAAFGGARGRAEADAAEAKRDAGAVEERGRSAAEREERIAKRREELPAKEAEIACGEEECAAKGRDVGEIEERGHALELRLNEVLRETSAIVAACPLAMVVGREQEMQELEKIYGLVTQHSVVLV
jgi:hypothetical protein